MIDKSLLITIISTNFSFFVLGIIWIVRTLSMIPRLRKDIDLAWIEIRKNNNNRDDDVSKKELLK